MDGRSSSLLLVPVRLVEECPAIMELLGSVSYDSPSNEEVRARLVELPAPLLVLGPESPEVRRFFLVDVVSPCNMDIHILITCLK